MYNPVTKIKKSEEFDTTNPKYKWFFGFHIADILKVLCALGIVVAILLCWRSFPHGFIYGIPMFIINSFAIIGIRKIRPEYLNHLIVLCFSNLVYTCCSSIPWILFLFGSVFIVPENYPELIFYATLVGCYIAFQAWFLRLAHRCQEYLEGMAALRAEQKSCGKKYKQVEERNADFDPTSSKYQCGCGYHVTTGVKVIIILGSIGTILLCFGALLRQLGIPVVAVYCYAFIGIKKLRPGYLIPLIVLFILNLIFITSLSAFEILKMFHDAKASKIPEEFLESMGLVVFLWICILMQTWFLLLAYRCREYLKGMSALRGEEIPLGEEYHQVEMKQE